MISSVEPHLTAKRGTLSRIDKAAGLGREGGHRRRGLGERGGHPDWASPSSPFPGAFLVWGEQILQELRGAETRY